MSTSKFKDIFSNDLLDIFEETFDIHHGVYLDKGTSLFETLDMINEIEASIPIGNKCATIAAQVEHVIFYLEVLQQVIDGREVGKADWGEIWSRVGEVSAEEWMVIKSRLRIKYEELKVKLQGIEDWEQNDAIGASMAIVVHTAYHLGEIRQALCFLGDSRNA